jgi:hypothetical protein
LDAFHEIQIVYLLTPDELTEVTFDVTFDFQSLVTSDLVIKPIMHFGFLYRELPHLALFPPESGPESAESPSRTFLLENDKHG